MNKTSPLNFFISFLYARHGIITSILTKYQFETENIHLLEMILKNQNNLLYKFTLKIYFISNQVAGIK